MEDLATQPHPYDQLSGHQGRGGKSSMWISVKKEIICPLQRMHSKPLERSSFALHVTTTLNLFQLPFEASTLFVTIVTALVKPSASRLQTPRPIATADTSPHAVLCFLVRYSLLQLSSSCLHRSFFPFPPRAPQHALFHPPLYHQYVHLVTPTATPNWRQELRSKKKLHMKEMSEMCEQRIT